MCTKRRKRKRHKAGTATPPHWLTALQFSLSLFPSLLHVLSLSTPLFLAASLIVVDSKQKLRKIFPTSIFYCPHKKAHANGRGSRAQQLCERVNASLKCRKTWVTHTHSHKHTLPFLFPNLSVYYKILFWILSRNARATFDVDVDVGCCLFRVFAANYSWQSATETHNNKGRQGWGGCDRGDDACQDCQLAWHARNSGLQWKSWRSHFGVGIARVCVE